MGATWTPACPVPLADRRSVTYGLAVDLNPSQNPYRHGNLVLPELASAYLDRDRVRPGMIRPGDVVTKAFAAIGWTWGGTWQSPTDHMHFSATGDERARTCLQ